MDRLRSLAGGLGFQVILVAIASRFSMLVMTWFTLKIFPPFDGTDIRGTIIGFSRWDSGHYISVAMGVYAGPDGEPVQSRGFFPLYPMTVRALTHLFHAAPERIHYAFWGVAIANVCFLAMIWLLARVVELHYGREIALTATTLLLVSPMSFFFNAGYSESMFQLTVVAAFWFAYRQRWIPATVAIALASATRLFGLILIPCVLYIAWKNRASLVQLGAIAVGGASGAFTFVLWMWIRFDDPLAYWHAQSTFWGDWQHRVGDYIDTFKATPMDMVRIGENTVIFINVALAVIAISTLPWVWRKVEPGLALFTTFIVVFHSVYTWQSLGRYLLAAIGVYIVLGTLLSRPGLRTGVRPAVYVGSAIVLMTMTMLFAHAVWIV